MLLKMFKNMLKNNCKFRWFRVISLNKGCLVDKNLKGKIFILILSYF